MDMRDLEETQGSLCDLEETQGSLCEEEKRHGDRGDPKVKMILGLAG